VGRQHRLTPGRGTLWVLGALAALGGGCSNAEQDRRAEARRQLLRAQNLDEERIARAAKTRQTTFDGDLLPSETKAAGITIPRGFKPKFDFEYEWYFDGEQPLSKLEKYLVERVDSPSIEHPDPTQVLFTQARAKGVPDMKPVTIKIYPVPGRSDWSRLNIVEQRPMPARIPTPEEVAAILAERRAHME
jgi:hypothetical protein